MSRSMLSRLAPLAFALTLALAVASPARAQEETPPADPNGESGRVGDGYFVCGALACATLFVVAKSARR